MKKYFILCILFLGAGILQAQIVITNNDLVGTGSTAIMSLDTIPAGTIGPGPAGPNQYWDFSALEEDWSDTIKFVKPSWTPYGNLFPEANFATHQFGVDNLYAMLYRDDSELSVVGMVMNFEEKPDTMIIIHMNPWQKVAEFPVQYGNNRKDTSRFWFTIVGPTPPVDSIRMQFTTIADIQVDGWGTATVPMGTFDVLRIKEQRVQIDCTFIYLGGQWIFQGEEIDTVDHYSWWSDDDATGIYLLEMDERHTPKGIIDNVLFLKETPTQGVEEIAEAVTVAAYPNPASTYIILVTEPGMKGTVEIRDIKGNLLQEVPCKGTAQHRISLEGMPCGVFVYTIRDHSGKAVATGKFIKQ